MGDFPPKVPPIFPNTTLLSIHSHCGIYKLSYLMDPCADTRSATFVNAARGVFIGLAQCLQSNVRSCGIGSYPWHTIEQC